MKSLAVMVCLWLFRIIWSSYVRRAKRSGLCIVGGPRWWISPVTDVAAWLRSLPLLEPAGAVLYLEGVHDSTLAEYLGRHPYPTPTQVAPLTKWPRQNFFHIAATPDQLEELAEVLALFEVKRLAIHAVLYREQRLLLEWYEAFCPPEELGVVVIDGEAKKVVESPMIAPVDVPEERVRAFATALGAAFRLKDVPALTN